MEASCNNTDSGVGTCAVGVGQFDLRSTVGVVETGDVHCVALRDGSALVVVDLNQDEVVRNFRLSLQILQSLLDRAAVGDSLEPVNDAQVGSVLSNTTYGDEVVDVGLVGTSGRVNVCLNRLLE